MVGVPSWRLVWFRGAKAFLDFKIVQLILDFGYEKVVFTLNVCKDYVFRETLAALFV